MLSTCGENKKETEVGAQVALETSASLVVTSALLVVTMFAIRNKKLLSIIQGISFPSLFLFVFAFEKHYGHATRNRSQLSKFRCVTECSVENASMGVFGSVGHTSHPHAQPPFQAEREQLKWCLELAPGGLLSTSSAETKQAQADGGRRGAPCQHGPVEQFARDQARCKTNTGRLFGRKS